MAGLAPAIHVFKNHSATKTWIPGKAGDDGEDG